MLSEREMRILAFERSWWRQPGAKEREILEVFGIPSTRYYQLLNELIDRPEAIGVRPRPGDQAAAAAGPAAPHAHPAGRRPVSLPEPVHRSGPGRAGRAGPRAAAGADRAGLRRNAVADRGRPGRRARRTPARSPRCAGLAGLVGTLAVITGRPAADAVELGGFGGVPGLIVLGHYGRERWHDGQLSRTAGAGRGRRGPGRAARRAGRRAARQTGTWIEDKGDALAVHTRRTADPAGGAGPAARAAGRAGRAHGLVVEPGRLVHRAAPGRARTRARR